MSLHDYLQGPILNNPLVRLDKIEVRAYQLSLARRAYEANTMVVLPTALGKTVVAALCAAQFLREEGAKVLILAPTRPLAAQHQETFRNLLRIDDADVSELTGHVDAREREAIWNDGARIFVATPQVVKNDVEGGRLSTALFRLIVFDECHRARKEYAYTHIAKDYVASASDPRILAMTASPGSTRERVEELCRALFIRHIEFRTEDDPDVAPYFKKVDVEWKLVDLPQEHGEISKLLRSMLGEKLRWLTARGFIQKKPEYINRRDLLELGERLRRGLGRGGNRGAAFSGISYQSASLSLYHTIELLETQGIQPLAQFLNKLDGEGKRSYAMIKNDPNYEVVRGLVELNRERPHPKVAALQRLVREQLQARPDSRVLVFTQYRDSASNIVEAIRGVAGDAVERFVGQASKAEDAGMSQQAQAEVLNRFRDGDIKVLVATSVAEEGLDVPAVDLVVFYEPVPSEIRFIQRKGRTGRRRVGRAVILATRDTLDTAYLYSAKRKVERMRRLIQSINRELSQKR